MSFELKAHTADVAVEATGGTLPEAFEAAADGLSAAHCESIPEGGDRFRITVAAESREALLFDYLDELDLSSATFGTSLPDRPPRVDRRRRRGGVFPRSLRPGSPDPSN